MLCMCHLASLNIDLTGQCSCLSCMLPVQLDPPPTPPLGQSPVPLVCELLCYTRDLQGNLIFNLRFQQPDGTTGLRDTSAECRGFRGSSSCSARGLNSEGCSTYTCCRAHCAQMRPKSALPDTSCLRGQAQAMLTSMTVRRYVASSAGATALL